VFCPFFYSLHPHFACLLLAFASVYHSKNAKTRGGRRRNPFSVFQDVFHLVSIASYLLFLLLTLVASSKAARVYFFVLLRQLQLTIICCSARGSGRETTKDGERRGRLRVEENEKTFSARKNMKTQFSFSRKSDGKNSPLRRERRRANGEEF
jgi:hypothetical protein